MKKNKNKTKTGIFRLIEIAGTKRYWLLVSILFAILATFVQFVPVVTVYLILSELASHATELDKIDRKLLFELGYISLGSVAAFGGLLYIALMLSHIAAFNILYEIRVKLAEKMTKLSMGYFTKRASGKIKKVMMEDVEQIELFVAHHITDITSAIVFPLIMIGYLFYVDWRLAIVTLLPLPLSLLIIVSMLSRVDLSRKYHDCLENMNSTVTEYVRGMPVVKIFGSIDTSFQKLQQSVFAFRDFSKKVSIDSSTRYPGFLTIASSSLLFIIPSSVFLLLYEEAYHQFLPTVFLFLIVGGGLFFPLLKLLYMGAQLQQIRVGVDRIDELLNQKEIIEVEEEKSPRDSSLIFDAVSFSYEEQTVLDQISFTALPNTVTALVGPSGAGKTTIGMLAARFWDVQAGSICIGGVDLKEMKIESLMDHVSFVFQDNNLFFDTIEANIRMGNTQASQKDVIEAAKAAQCHEFIEALPQGYQTKVGAGGTYVSGGEQQRIGIARVILKNTPIVVLDEATAFADPENEKKILEAFAHLVHDKTVLVIAHRLSTITNADQILVVDRGRIVQRGRHQELLDINGLYQTMWETYTRSREWAIEKKREV